MPRLPICHPVRERCNDIDPVVSLRLAVADIILEARARANRALLLVVIPFEPIGPSGIPSVSDHKKRRSISLLEGMVVGGGPQEAAPQRVRSFFVFIPLDCCKLAGFPGEAWILGAGPAVPGPRSGCRGQKPNTRLRKPGPLRSTQTVKSV